MTEQDKHITHIADLIIAELTGKIDDAGRNELENWKHETPEHLRLYNLYQSPDFIARKFEFIKEYSAIEAYQEFAGRVKWAKHRKRTLALYRYVAAVVLLFVLSGSFYFFHDTKDESIAFVQKIQPGSCKAILTEPDGTKIDISDTTFLAFVQKSVMSRKNGEEKEVVETLYHTITIPRGGEYDLLLSDGSRLRMNSESEIRVPVTFEKGQREVFMKGEIYFDIVRDSLAPFVVHTHQGDIRVLGTSFNVRDYQDENFLETTLVNGKVAFEREGNYSYLKPGEQLRLNKEDGKTTVETVDVLLYCSWKDGRFVFEKQRLEVIMNTIARWYNINVFYESSSVKDILFTGNIKRYSDLEQVVNMLKLINKIDIEIKDRNVFVRSNE
ncbi:FecR family protein [Butyricimonas faecihominis]|uniref:FecR family protein n=1 Tax=Butyricimonas faecihominis TaxID=1472416 RepID=UPI0032C16C2E